MLETGSPDKEMDITEYLRIFSRQRWTIVCCLAAAVALTFIYTEHKIPVYKASAIIKDKIRFGAQVNRGFLFFQGPEPGKRAEINNKLRRVEKHGLENGAYRR